MIVEVKTQQQVADEIGRSGEKIKHFTGLEKISPNTWELIGKAISKNVRLGENGAANEKDRRKIRSLFLSMVNICSC